MSASSKLVTEIECDAAGCGELEQVNTDSFSEARAEAARYGWTHDPVEKLDWCPTHSRTGSKGAAR
jgi:hypothetical protein